jgi:hypothetical protein
VDVNLADLQEKVKTQENKILYLNQTAMVKDKYIGVPPMASNYNVNLILMQEVDGRHEEDKHTHKVRLHLL